MTVPCHRCEEDFGVASFLDWDIACVELLAAISPGVNEVVLTAFALVIVLTPFTVSDELEGGQKRVEGNLVFRKNAELVLVPRVELHRQEVALLL